MVMAVEVAATSSPSLHRSYSSSCASNPNSTHSFTVYPSFPHSHLAPLSLSLSLFQASKDRVIAPQSISLATHIPALQMKFQTETQFGGIFFFAHLPNVDRIPLSQAMAFGLEMESGDEDEDEEIVNRADSVKKKRKRKMNKHKLMRKRKRKMNKHKLMRKRKRKMNKHKRRKLRKT